MTVKKTVKVWHSLLPVILRYFLRVISKSACLCPLYPIDAQCRAALWEMALLKPSYCGMVSVCESRRSLIVIPLPGSLLEFS